MRYKAAALALAVAAAPAVAQDHAVPRGGGSSGGGSSSSGASHNSGGSSSSGSSSGGSSYSGSSGGSSYSSTGGAERRHPRAGTGTGRYGSGSYNRGGSYYPGYYPWYPWYYPSSYAWGPYWGSYYYGYWPYGAYYSGGYARSYRSSNDDTGAIRVLVDPEDAKVYVDGYYAGKVDDFDGFTQRLYVSRGPHEILLKREGYRSQRYRVYVITGETLKIEYDMSKGQGEETLQDLTGGRGDIDRYAADPGRTMREDREDDQDTDDLPPARPGRDDARIDLGTHGRLDLRVWPGDASVYVDGEFRGTGRQLPTLDMTPGSHRIEVVRPGFPTFQREVEIRAGRTEDLQVTLEQQP
jgi:PEGA domain